jgi:membrane protease subunit HflK
MNLKIRIALISVGVNILLVGLKLLLARWSRSASIHADAVHSLSDIFVSLLVLSSLVLGALGTQRRTALWRKIEDVVAILVGLFILGAAVQIFTTAVTSPPRELTRLPLALLGIFVCILVSGFIARLKIKVGTDYRSTSLVADGYHSRMDMFSSVGVLIGLVGSMIGLNLDVQAAALIALLIAATGLEVIYGGIRALLRGTHLEEYLLAGLFPGARTGSGPMKGSGGRILQVALWLHRRGRTVLVGSLILLALLWILTGVYQVGTGERALVFRFGRLLKGSGQGPGLYIHLPWPIESVRKAQVDAVRRIEIGFRTQLQESPGGNTHSYQWESRHVRGRYVKKPEESIMFTGDENLIDVNAIVQYRVSDPKAFLLHMENPQDLVRSSAEESIRKVVSMEPLDDLFTTGRIYVERKIEEILQNTMSAIGSGILVTSVRLQDVHPPVEVVDYFRDVASAREDKNRLINEAYAYRNEVLPTARGTGAEQIFKAEAEKQERIHHARGEADKFIALVRQYGRARTVTEVRMFLETVDAVLPDLEKFIVEPHASYEPIDLRFFDERTQDVLTVEER